MLPTAILGLCVVALLSALFLLVKERVNQRRKPDESLTRLEEMIRSSELTNNVFFRSLELIQKNLESLIARADGAEQRLRTLTLQCGVEKRHHYEAAATLLSEGKDATRIAAMLNLPVNQVQLVEQLRGAVKNGKKTARRNKQGTGIFPPRLETTEIAASQEKIAAEPILLTDVVNEMPVKQQTA